jgi:hypothetical protein
MILTWEQLRTLLNNATVMNDGRGRYYFKGQAQ